MLTGLVRAPRRSEQEAESIRGTLSPRSLKPSRARFYPAVHLPSAHHGHARRRHRPYTHGVLLLFISIAAVYAVFNNSGFPGGQSEAFAAPVTGLSLPGVGSSVPPSQQSVLRPPAINKTLRAVQPVNARQQEEAQQFAALGATPTAVPATQEDAVVRAASVAPAPDLPPYQVYEVQEGDTVSSIAARFGLDAQYILANNPEIMDSDFLTLGQSMIVPAGNGILHEVRYGETLSDISTRYNVDMASITSFEPNRITTPDDITETQLVFVPGGAVPVFAPPVAEPLPDAGGPADDGGTAGDDGGGDAAAGAPAAGGIVSTGPSSNAGLMWPVVGPISSYYGSGHPLGIDIDGFNLVGSPIAAATSGTVVFAGGNACCSYGLYVVVLSPEGIETLYAHMSSISVVEGQSVSQGEAVGVIGNTGYSTGVHLHFEVIDNGARVNPLGYLP